MGIHRHDPIRRIDPIVAPPRAYVRVARKNCAMQHQHVGSEHEHFAIHRCGIREPACARALAAHRIGNVHRGLHRHPCRSGAMRRRGHLVGTVVMMQHRLAVRIVHYVS